MINQITTNGSIVTAVTMNGFLYVGGSFTNLNGFACSNFAEISLVTGNPTGFFPLFDGPVVSMAVCGSKLVVVGQFSYVDAVSNSAIAIIDQPTRTFSNVLSNLGLTDQTSIFVGPSQKAFPYKAKYHTNSGFCFVGGYFWLSDGTNIRQGVLAFNPTSNTILPFNPLINQQNFNGWDIDQTNNKLFHPLSTGAPWVGAWDLSTITSISISSWSPQCTIQKTPSIFCVNGKVFISDGSGNAGVFASDVSSNVYYGMVAVDAVTGVLDGVNWQMSKNAFLGDIRVNSIVYSGGYYYVGGSWSHVLCDASNPNLNLQQALYSAPRPSLMVRDSSNGYIFKGDNVAFNGPAIIHYIPPSSFYQNEPDIIQSIILDEAHLHLFGSITWVDGQPGNTHYIMNADGTRFQDRFLYLI